MLRQLWHEAVRRRASITGSALIKRVKRILREGKYLSGVKCHADAEENIAVRRFLASHKQARGDDIDEVKWSHGARKQK